MSFPFVLYRSTVQTSFPETPTLLLLSVFVYNSCESELGEVFSVRWLSLYQSVLICLIRNSVQVVSMSYQCGMMEMEIKREFHGSLFLSIVYSIQKHVALYWNTQLYINYLRMDTFHLLKN